MTISAVPFGLQNVPINADVVRQAVSSLIPNGGGLVAAGDLAVTQLGTPAMGVQVGVGRAWIDGTNVAHLSGQGYGKQGMYFVMNDAAFTVTIATSDATNPRIDVIYASILDSQYAGGGDGAVLGVATGTPTAGATYPANAPAVPNNAVKLAWVMVGAGVTTITTSNITALATMFGTSTQFIAINSTTTGDSNWSYVGGMWVDTRGDSKTRVHLNLRLTRTGANFGLTTTYLQSLALIPSGYRAAYGVTRYAVLQDGAGAEVWGMYARIDPNGNLFLRTDTGTSTMATGRQFELDSTWLI